MEKYFEIELMMWTFQCDLNEVMAWKDAVTFFSGVKHVSGMGGGGGMAVPSNSYTCFQGRTLIKSVVRRIAFWQFFQLTAKKSSA